MGLLRCQLAREGSRDGEAEGIGFTGLVPGGGREVEGVSATYKEGVQGGGLC